VNRIGVSGHFGSELPSYHLVLQHVSHRNGASGPVVHFIISTERRRRNKLRSLVRYGLGRDDPWLRATFTECVG
jgi:hypothetical protein